MISRHTLGDAYPIRKLGDIVDFLDNFRKPVKESERVAGPYPYFGANGIQGFISDYIFDEPLVLLAEDGGHFENPDRGIAYRIEGKSWVNNHAHVLRPRPSVDLAYLCRVLENYDVTPWVTGTTRGKLTKAGASEIEVPMPPLPEQRRIAAILDKADALRAKRREAIAKIDQLLQSVFLDMFGDPVKNPKGWPTCGLEELVKFTGGSQPPKTAFSDTPLPGYIRLVQIRDFRTDKYVTYIPEKLARRRFKSEDVMIGRYGPPVFQIFRGLEGSYNVALIKAEPRDRLRRDYLFYLLKSDSIQASVIENSQRSSGQSGVNLDFLHSIEVGVPTIDLQEKFAAIVKSLTSQRALQVKSEVQTERLFSSLQSRVFVAQ